MAPTKKEQEYRILFEYDSRTQQAHVRLVKVLLPLCPQAHVTRLCNLRNTSRTRYPTDVKEIEVLLTYLNESLQGTFEDPTCGIRTIEKVLQAHYPSVGRVECYDIDPSVLPTVVLDALNPYELNCLQGCHDYIIFSPIHEQSTSSQRETDVNFWLRVVVLSHDRLRVRLAEGGNWRGSLNGRSGRAQTKGSSGYARWSARQVSAVHHTSHTWYHYTVSNK